MVRDGLVVTTTCYSVTLNLRCRTHVTGYVLASVCLTLPMLCDSGLGAGMQSAECHSVFNGTRQNVELGGSPLVSFDHVIDPHFVTFSSSLYTTISNPNPNTNPNPNHGSYSLKYIVRTIELRS